MRRSNVELPVDAGVEVTSGFSESTDLPFWGVEVPGLGELWSYNRDALVYWLRRAADSVNASPAPGPVPAEDESRVT